MADLLTGMIALALTLFMGGTGPEAYIVAILAMCYVQLCDIGQKVSERE